MYALPIENRGTVRWEDLAHFLRKGVSLDLRARVLACVQVRACLLSALVGRGDGTRGGENGGEGIRGALKSSY